MCGITGFSLSETDAQKVDARKLADALLMGIEVRGRDATGIAYSTPHDNTYAIRYRKQAVPASRFVVPGEVAGSRVAIGHTRLATQGDPSDNRNNHPIIRNRRVNGRRESSIVGVHNGVIYNDPALMREYECEWAGAVDSQAIFAALTKADPKEVMEKIQGSMAVAWIDTLHPETINLARGAGSPLVYAFTEGGSLVFASTDGAIRDGLKAVDLKARSGMVYPPVGRLFTVTDGHVKLCDTFTPAETPRRAHTGRVTWTQDKDGTYRLVDGATGEVPATACGYPRAALPAAAPRANEHRSTFVDRDQMAREHWEGIYADEADVDWLADELDRWEEALTHLETGHDPRGDTSVDFYRSCAECENGWGYHRPVILDVQARAARDVLIETLDEMLYPTQRQTEAREEATASNRPALPAGGNLSGLGRTPDWDAVWAEYARGEGATS